MTQELKENYPHSNHAPDPNCGYCQGSGENQVAMPDGEIITTGCICIYVSHHVAGEVGQIVSDAVGAAKI